MKCNNCNAEIVNGAEFCGNCGAKIIKTQDNMPRGTGNFGTN